MGGGAWHGSSMSSIMLSIYYYTIANIQSCRIVYIEFELILNSRPGIQNNINLNNSIYNQLCTINTVVYNRIQLHTIVYCCIGLYTFVYDCIRLYTIVYNSIQLYTIVNIQSCTIVYI